VYISGVFFCIVYFFLVPLTSADQTTSKMVYGILEIYQINVAKMFSLNVKKK